MTIDASTAVGRMGERPKRGLRAMGWRAWALLFTVNLAGASSMLFLLQRAPELSSEPAELLAPTLAAVMPVAVQLDVEACDEASWAAMEQQWLGQSTSLHAGAATRSYTRAELGARLLPVEVRNPYVFEADVRVREASLPLRCDGQSGETTLRLLLFEDSLRGVLSHFATKLERNAVDARWDFARSRLMGGVSGRRLDIEASMQAIASGLSEGAARIDLVLEEYFELPLGEQDLGSATPSVLLASYSTRFTRNRDRIVNLSLTSKALDGIVLMSGQTMSYNARVGPRTEVRGFREAPVIEQGEIVEGMGGGACQVSSTLHAAALFAGLDIVLRYNHSLPSSYIEKGLDATVSYPDLDLQLRNPYPFPIFLQLRLDEEHLRAQIWGSSAGKQVKLRREVVQVIPFQDVVTIEPLREPGTLRVTADGKVGYKVSRARIIRDGDAEQFERLSTDIYQSRSRKLSLGPQTSYDPLTLEPSIIP